MRRMGVILYSGDLGDRGQGRSYIGLGRSYVGGPWGPTNITLPSDDAPLRSVRSVHRSDTTRRTRYHQNQLTIL